MNHSLRTTPRIGMGCWAIGGPFWNGDIPVGYAGSDDAESIRTIHAAWDSGVRVFDTSAVYGAGHSETLLGSALKTRPGAIIISKFGHSFNGKTKQMTGPQFDPAYVRASIDRSRSRLGRDRIDVMLLHLNGLSVDEAKPAFDTLDELVQEGKIAAYGWSTDFPDSLDAFANKTGFVAVQHVMNVFFDAPGLSNLANAQNVTQLIRSPLGMGVLTGKFSDNHQVPVDDVRRDDGNGKGFFRDGRIDPDCAVQLDSVRELLTTGGRTLTQGALGWLLAKSDNVLPIPGAKTAAQAVENAGAMEFGPLPDTVMAEIETILDRDPEEPLRAR